MQSEFMRDVEAVAADFHYKKDLKRNADREGGAEHQRRPPSQRWRNLPDGPTLDAWAERTLKPDSIHLSYVVEPLGRYMMKRFLIGREDSVVGAVEAIDTLYRGDATLSQTLDTIRAVAGGLPANAVAAVDKMADGVLNGLYEGEASGAEPEKCFDPLLVALFSPHVAGFKSSQFFREYKEHKWR